MIEPGHYRIRVLPQGPGLQIRDLQEFIATDEIPKAYRNESTRALRYMAEQGFDTWTKAIAEGRDAERDVANDHPLPPGLGYGEPDAVMVLVERVPE